MAKIEKKLTPKPTPKVTASSSKYGYIGEKLDFAFGKENYILMLVGFGVLFIGYLLMIGGGSNDPNEFNYALFNTQRMVIAPLVLLAGFAIEFVAIMKRPKD
jgi:predicted histidine transporter YuiF (NhaC family)